MRRDSWGHGSWAFCDIINSMVAPLVQQVVFRGRCAGIHLLRKCQHTGSHDANSFYCVSIHNEHGDLAFDSLLRRHKGKSFLQFSVLTP